MFVTKVVIGVFSLLLATLLFASQQEETGVCHGDSEEGAGGALVYDPSCTPGELKGWFCADGACEKPRQPLSGCTCSSGLTALQVAVALEEGYAMLLGPISECRLAADETGNVYAREAGNTGTLPLAGVRSLRRICWRAARVQGEAERF